MSGIEDLNIESTEPAPSLVGSPADYKAVYSFYPNPRYIQKNLRPETMPFETLQSLARAQKAAIKTGIMSPEVANYMLANTLTENRPLDYGVNEVIATRNNDPYKHFASKLGIAPTAMNVTDYDQEGNPISKPSELLWYDRKPIDPTSDQPPTYDQDHAAKVAAMVLAYKASQTKTPEMAIIRWNGQGPAAVNHLRKVKKMRQMLDNPANTEIREVYNRLLSEED